MAYPHLDTLADLYKYANAFREGAEGLNALSSGGCSECEECGSEEVDSHFSWSPCPICRRRLGGYRYPAHYLDDNNKVIHIDICIDCVYFMEYGTLDDQTMLEIENAAPKS